MSVVVGGLECNGCVELMQDFQGSNAVCFPDDDSKVREESG